MNIIKAHNLTCPIDGGRIEQNNRQFICANGHSFDIARQGYVNLLPVQHKRSKQPGDSKAMVLARTEFLNSGIYEKIASKLTEIVITLIGAVLAYVILFPGCKDNILYFQFDLTSQLFQDVLFFHKARFVLFPDYAL